MAGLTAARPMLFEPDVGRLGTRRLPWTFRLFDASPLSPVPTSLALMSTALSVYIAIEVVAGRLPALLADADPAHLGCAYLAGDYRISVIGIFTLGAVSAARALLAGWTLETLDELRPHSTGDVPALRSLAWRSHVAGAAFALLALTVAFDIVARPVEATDGYWIWPHVFNWAWCVPFGWSLGRLFYAAGSDCAQLKRAARDLRDFDLFQSTVPSIFVRASLRTILLFAIVLGLCAINLIEPGGDPYSAAVATLLLLSGGIVGLRPLVGIRARLRATKRVRLGRVRESIAESCGDVLANRPRSESLEDLLALEARIHAVHEWPLTAFGNLRLVFYLALGLASWFGAALVERGLDALLG